MFCIAKETKKTIHRMGEITVNEATNKGLICKIQRQLMQLNIKKINSPIKKWAENLNRRVFKEDIQIARKHMKRCSTSLSLETQMKTTMSHHLIQVRMAIIKKSRKNNCWRGCREKGALLTLFLGM